MRQVFETAEFEEIRNSINFGAEIRKALKPVQLCEKFCRCKWRGTS